MSICKRAEKEVIDFHDFLTNIFTGRFDGNPLDKLLAFEEDFCYVRPDGGTIGKDALRDTMPNWLNAHPNINVSVNILQSYELSETSCIVLYEEHQVGGVNGDNKRISSAIFVAVDEKPSAVRWRHLHETWLSHS